MGRGRRPKGAPPPPPKHKNPWGVRIHNGLTGEEVIAKLKEALETMNAGDRIVLPEVALGIGVTKKTLDNWRSGDFTHAKGVPILKFSPEQQEEITYLIDIIYTYSEVYYSGLLEDRETVRGGMFILERVMGYMERKEHNIKGDGSVKIELGDAEKYAK